MEWLAKENSDIDLSKVRACALFMFFLVIFNPRLGTITDAI